MKVLYFHQHFSTPKGSSGTRSYEMAKRLVLHGHQVTMVCGSYNVADTGLNSIFVKGKRCGKVDGIDVVEFDLAYSNADGLIKRSWAFLKFSLRSIKLVMVESYDVVFATTTPLTAGIPGIVARWLRRKPFVFEVRDLWPELPKVMGVIKNPFTLQCLLFLEWLSYRSATRCIGLSSGIVQGIKQRGVRSADIALIPNGCDLGIFSSSVQAWRPDGVLESDLMAIFTGAHGIANGLDAVVAAAIELQKRGRIDIKVVLVGDGKLKLSLIQQAEQAGLVNLLFLNPISKEKVAGLMAAADVGMQILANVPAFYFGTSPNKFFDYIAAGLPVLNNYPGWLAELIKIHRCGYVVSPGDPAAFADVLEHAANHRGQLIEMSANAKALAENDFNRAKLADDWVSWVVGAVK